MNRLADDDRLRTRLGEAGRRNAVERFAPPRLGRETLAIYDEILSRP